MQFRYVKQPSVLVAHATALEHRYRAVQTRPQSDERDAALVRIEAEHASLIAKIDADDPVAIRAAAQGAEMKAGRRDRG